jgi:hypothetical protein
MGKPTHGLNIGFSGQTGLPTNIHEIGNIIGSAGWRPTRTSAMGNSPARKFIRLS